MTRRRWDPVAIVAALLAVIMLVVYLRLMRQEASQPVLWFLAALVSGATAAAYGANIAARHRGAALLLAGLVLAAVGVLAILSIGFPILVAGGLCLIAAARSTSTSSAVPS